MNLRRYVIAALLLLAVYAAIIPSFAGYMQRRPYAEQLGLIPRPVVLKALFSDYRQLVGASIITRVILYFGTVVEHDRDLRNLTRKADYPAMSRTLFAAAKLDPYNMDGYYFGQAILTWDVGQYKIANDLLEYGMKYRTWDWQLPYYVGFNDAFFLKDYADAAKMYMRAGELSGDPLFKSLAGRYLEQAGHTRMAIDYLRVMVKNARNPAVRKTFAVRLEAFQQVLIIEKARDRFTKDRGVPPATIDQLVAEGYLTERPVDPYGGRFYLDANHQVRSTSKFAFARQTPASGGKAPARPPSSK